MISSEAETLRTTAGDVPLQDFRLRLGAREWSILHADTVVSRQAENRYLEEDGGGLPYGVALWPSAIALAHEIAARPADFRGQRVLELGSGTGLPGIVAASAGARVLQTDRQPLAMALCRRNAERNGVAGVGHRIVDWAHWESRERFDWILGADVLYAVNLHDALRRIFQDALEPGGRLLLADPFRHSGLEMLEGLEARGWSISLSKWTVADENGDPRPVGVYELSHPG